MGIFMIKPDPASYERLANDVYVYGSVSLALAMAKETGLVHCLCTAHSPLSSPQMATQLTLKERYLRKLLNTLTVGGLVQRDTDTRGEEGREARYWVPLTCRQVLQKIGTTMLVYAHSARNYAHVRQCFDLDGPYGIHYEPNAYTVMDETARAELDNATEAILKTPGLKEGLEKGLRALDMGCGTGTMSLHMAALFPQSHFTLTDLTPQPVEAARQQAQTQNLTNVSFQLLDGLNVPDDLKGSFDWVLCRNVVHDLPCPAQALKEIFKVLGPGGHFSMLDMFVSSYVAENVKRYRSAAAMYGLGTFNCIVQSYQDADCQALGACWGVEKATELVEDAGMRVLGVTWLEDFVVRALCMCQKPG